MSTPKGPWTLPGPVLTEGIIRKNFLDEGYFRDPISDEVQIRKDTSQVTATEMQMKMEAVQAAMNAQNKRIDYDALRQIMERLNAMPSAPAKLSMNDARDRTQMLCMRLRCTLAEFPFKHYTTIFANGKVYVTIIQNEVPVMFVDDADLYPSDTLVSQLALLRE